MKNNKKKKKKSNNVIFVNKIIENFEFKNKANKNNI